MSPGSSSLVPSAQQKQVPSAPSNSSTSQSALVSSQSHTSLLSSANLKQAEPLAKAPASSIRQPAKQQPIESGPMANDNLALMAAPLDQASPIVLAKSASSSSVLSSVSLASGAQIRQHQNLVADRSATGGLGEQQRAVAKLDNSTGGQSNAALLASTRLSELSETETDDADKTASAKSGDAFSVEPKDSDPADDVPDLQLLVAVARDPQIQTPKPQITELKRLLRHTNSLNEIPEFGIETENEEELAQLIDQVDVWGLNIFEVHTFSQQHSLTAVMYKIFKVSIR